jgi:hypothetical protein
MDILTYLEIFFRDPVAQASLLVFIIIVSYLYWSEKKAKEKKAKEKQRQLEERVKQLEEKLKEKKSE